MMGSHAEEVLRAATVLVLFGARAPARGDSRIGRIASRPGAGSGSEPVTRTLGCRSVRTSEAGLFARTPPRGRSRQGGRAVHRLVLAVALCVASGIARAVLLDGSGRADDMAGVSGEVPLAASFAKQVEPRLRLPQEEIAAYAVQLQQALDAAQVRLAAPQFLVLVDRSPKVQAALLYWGSTERGWGLVGATPVSTGLPGRYEHFTTPLGVFDHSTANPDFRAEGTKNKLGFRGYGRKGMRIYDFGWVDAPRGWGKGEMGVMRLQMHATDPDLAAQRLGTPQSEGCVRIPASLNEFIDRNALLDEDYLRELDRGAHLWVLRADRTPTSWSGRYLVVVDSNRVERPVWSPLPPRQ